MHLIDGKGVERARGWEGRLNVHMWFAFCISKDDKHMTLMLLVSTLQAFIEGSSLGEFHVRLQMLLVFHCHVLLMPQAEGKGEGFFLIYDALFVHLEILPHCEAMTCQELAAW